MLSKSFFLNHDNQILQFCNCNFSKENIPLKRLPLENLQTNKTRLIEIVQESTMLHLDLAFFFTVIIIYHKNVGEQNTMLHEKVI